jgi:hypothetical protein
MSITLVVEQAKSASTKPPTTITCATTRVTTGPFQSPPLSPAATRTVYDPEPLEGLTVL